MNFKNLNPIFTKMSVPSKKSQIFQKKIFLNSKIEAKFCTQIKDKQPKGNKTVSYYFSAPNQQLCGNRNIDKEKTACNP